MATAPAGLPVVPWAEIHDGLGVENRDFVVLREFRGDLAHGPGIRGIQRLAVRLWVLRVARRDRRNQRLLARACLGGERPRLLCRGKGGRHGLVLHRQIDVGAEHERLAPEAHGARRIELLRLAKGALCLAVIERIRQAQSLVEIGLRRRVRGRDLVAHRAQSVPQGRIRIGERRGRCRGLHFRLRHLGPRGGEAQHRVHSGSRG